MKTIKAPLGVLTINSALLGRISTSWILRLLLLLRLPAVVQAQDYAYTTDNGSITVTAYHGSGGTVTIPSTIDGLPVKRIGDYAFFGATVTIVTIPNSVTSIGVEAFWSCTRLTSITIPNSVTNIGTYAFSDCTSLGAITVDALNLVYSNMEGVLFDKNQTTIIQCPGGKAGNYTIPNTATSIGDWAFWNCTSLTSVTIPNSVTIIGDSAFYGCTSLTNVIVPNSVTSIGGGAFFGCTSLTSVTIPNRVTTIGGGAFYFCTSLTNVIIPNSVTSIGDSAFYGCTGMTSVTIPNRVTTIGDSAFYGCTNLISITIPNSVTSIGNNTFFGCTSLTSVTIPNSVTNIGTYAFSFCTSLGAITVDALNPVYSSMEGVLFDKNQTTIIQCPGGKAGNYTIPNTATSIGDWAFWNCTSLTSVTIPNSVTIIGDSAFYGCTSLTNVIVPNSVTTIGGGAFFACSSLTSVTIPNSVTTIGDQAFYFCTSLTNVIIPNSVTRIGLEAFADCTSLTSVTIGNSVTNIGQMAFASCTSLTSVTIPNSVTTIGDSAFYGCTSLTGVYFHGNTPLGPSLFDGVAAIVYYLPGTLGWGPTFGGLPTAPWSLPYPLILTSGQRFGVQTNGFGFIISWATNTSVVVEACTNLANANWSPVATIPLTDGTSYFSDPEWTNYPARFYRLRSP